MGSSGSPRGSLPACGAFARAGVTDRDRVTADESVPLEECGDLAAAAVGICAVLGSRARRRRRCDDPPGAWVRVRRNQPAAWGLGGGGRGCPRWPCERRCPPLAGGSSFTDRCRAGERRAEPNLGCMCVLLRTCVLARPLPRRRDA